MFFALRIFAFLASLRLNESFDRTLFYRKVRKGLRKGRKENIRLLPAYCTDFVPSTFINVIPAQAGI
jgi:hypothetical protein